MPDALQNAPALTSDDEPLAVRETVVMLEDVTPRDALVIVRLGSNRVGVRQHRASDGPASLLFRLVPAPSGATVVLRQVNGSQRIGCSNE